MTRSKALLKARHSTNSPISLFPAGSANAHRNPTQGFYQLVKRIVHLHELRCCRGEQRFRLVSNDKVLSIIRCAKAGRHVLAHEQSLVMRARTGQAIATPHHCETGQVRVDGVTKATILVSLLSNKSLVIATARISACSSAVRGRHRCYHRPTDEMSPRSTACVAWSPGCIWATYTREETPTAVRSWRPRRHRASMVSSSDGDSQETDR